jgi:hypothetical protein
MAHGCPRQAIVVACGYDERPVPWWRARAGVQGQAVQAPLVEQPRDLGQVPADAIRVKTQGGLVWMALALLVKTRLWRAGAVSPRRDLPLMRRRIARGRGGARQRPRLCCTEGWCASIRALRETLRAPERTGAHGRPRWRPWRHLLLAQVVKRSEPRRVAAVERRSVAGTPARVETLRRRSQGDGVIATADIERLNAPCRERLAALTRRGRTLARRPVTLEHGMDLVGTISHFCTPHERLGHPPGAQTPAMAAGITDHVCTVEALLSLPVPPPCWSPPKQRGRSSRALKGLIERWCS